MSSLDEPLIEKASARKRATFQLSASDAGGSSSSDNDGPRWCRGGKGIASQQSSASVSFEQGALRRGKGAERVVNPQSDSSTFSETSAKRARNNHRNVQVVAAKREWGALGDSSSSSDEADFVESPKRCHRYRCMAAAMSVVSSAHTAKSSEVKATPAQVADTLNEMSGDFQMSQGRRAALDWCLGFVAMWSFALAELYMVSFSPGLLAPCMLPILFFLIFLEICLARSDPGIMRSRCELKRQAAGCVVIFEVGVVVALGIFFGYHLVLAYRCMFQADFSHTFATELEALDPCRKLLAGALRRDSWDLFWMPVASIVFTWDAIRSCRNDTTGFTVCFVVVAVLQTSSVVSLSQYDGCVSLHLRERNGIRFQAFKWVRQATNARNVFLFETKHLLYRATELASRVLVLAVVFRYVHNPLLVLVLFLVDMSVLVFALSPTKSSIIEACLLLLPFSLYDVGRFLDEPGFAWPSQRESKIVNRLRASECLAAIMCSCLFLVRGDSFALWTLPPILLLSAAKTALWNYTELSSIAGDIFTAIAQGQLKDVQSRVEFEGCSTINLLLKDGTNRLPLHIAASASALDVAKFLLESRAEVHARDCEGDTPLHYACRKGDLAMVGAILSADKSGGATIGVEKNLRQQSPADVLPLHLRPKFVEMVESIRKPAVVDDEDGDEFYCDGANGHDDSIMQLQTTIGIWNNAPDIGSGFMRQLSRTHKLFQTDICKLLVFRGLGEHCERLAEIFSNHHQSSGIQLQYLTVDKVLGVGSFGKVMKVQDVRTGTFYAMKLQCKNKSMKQAVREAKTLHTNRHPFVVDLIHIFKTKAFYGILLEYCPCDLNARILSFGLSTTCVGGLPVHLTSRYTACIMLALEYLHLRHVVYRDLKPENILITDGDQGNYAKLTDFGLARSLKPVMESMASETPLESSPGSESSSRSGRPRLTCKAGTLAFMPHEAIDDDPNSTTCDDVEFDEEKVVARDWYGLGCCMLLMLLGERGGVRIVSGKREVLLPPQRASMIPGILSAALKDKLIDEDAHELVTGLTEQSLTLRMNATALRESPFLEDVILQLERENGLRQEAGVSSSNSLTNTDASATCGRRNSDGGDCSQADCDDLRSQRPSTRDFSRRK